MIALTHRDVDYLTGDDDPKTAADLKRRVAGVMEGKRRFVRLNSRSPKDVVGPEGPITASATQAIGWLRASHSRARPDLLALRSAGLPAQICLRDVIQDIATHEYRCVVLGGQLVGVAETRSRRLLKSTVGFNASAVLAKLTWLIESILAPHAHNPDFVVDAFCPPSLHRAVLIEINPLMGADTFEILS